MVPLVKSTPEQPAAGAPAKTSAETEAAPSPNPAMAPSGGIAALPYSDRVLASASYLAALGGFWLVVPALVFLWRGRKSPFLGFHAVQAIFLQVATIPIAGVGLGLAYALSSLIVVLGSDKLVPLAAFLLFGIGGVAMTIPTAATVWMGMCALRGQPRELPLLGRWARNVVRDV
jgi:uncharacterized membrane protein